MAISAGDFLSNWSDFIARGPAFPGEPGRPGIPTAPPDGRPLLPGEKPFPAPVPVKLASHNIGPQIGAPSQQFAPMQVGPPLNWNVDLNEGGIEQGNINYTFPQNNSGGQWSTGVEVRPGYSQPIPGMYPGAPGMTQEIPTEYRGGVKYQTPNWSGGVTYGTRGTNVHGRLHY